MPTVGNLIVNLSADTASFAKDLKRASDLAFGTSKEIDRSMRLIGTAALTGLGVAAGALLAVTKQAITLGAETLALSQKAGVSTEAFSALQFAAKQSNVDVEALSKGMKFLSKAMLDTGTGGTKTAKFFEALGVSVTESNGTLRQTDQVLLDLAEIFSHMPDGAEKTGIALKLFGKAGSDMIPMLNQGKAGLQAFEEQAKRLGIVIGKDFAEAAHQMEQKMQHLEARERSLGLVTAQILVPWLLNLYDAVSNFKGVDFFQGFQYAMTELQDNPAISKLATDAERLGAGFEHAFASAKRIGAEIGRMQALDQTKEHDKNAKALAALVAGLEKQAATLRLNSAQLKIYEASELGASAAVQEHVRLLTLKVVKLDSEKIAFTELGAAAQYFQNIQDKIKASDLQALGQSIEDTLHAANVAGAAASATIINLQREIPPSRVEVLNIGDAMRRFGEQSGSAFRSAILHGQNFSQALKAILVDLAQLIIKMTLFKAISGMIGAGGTTGIFGSLFKGLIGMAGGGMAMAGQPVIVGESGPELFIPSTAGTVVPNGVGAGGGPTVNNFFDFRGADSSSIPRIQQAAKEIENRAVARAVSTIREMSLRNV